MEFSLAELAVIVVVSVLVLGPKELPTVLRHVTGFLRQMRQMAAQVRSQIESLGDDTEFGKLRQEWQEQARYIKDEQGALHRVYDLSDLGIAPPDAEKPPVQIAAKPDDVRPAGE